MKKKIKVKRHILNYYPLLISLFFFIVILLLHPFNLKKYKIESEGTVRGSDNSFYTFADLDNDGYSEKIRILCLEEKNLTGIVVYENNRVLNQWNFDGIIKTSSPCFMIGDYDHDNYKEITLFTSRNDTLFLNMIEPFPDEKLEINGQSMHSHTKPVIGLKENTFSINSGRFANMDGHANDELVFCVGPGAYNKQPRRLIIYNPSKDILLISPKAGVLIDKLHVFDLNNDSIPEITGDAHAFGNLNMDFPYTDMLGWLMVFNNQLDFVFEPVSFREFPMKLCVEPFQMKGENFLFVYQKYYGVKDITPKLYIYNKNGEKVRSKDLSSLTNPRRTNILSNKDELYFIDAETGRILWLNKALKEKKQWSLPEISSGNLVFRGDLNDDNSPEFVFRGKKTNEFIVTQDNLRHPVSFQIPFTNRKYHFTIRQKGEEKTLLYVQTNKTRATYSYQKNLLYNFRYPLYAGLFGAIWLIVKIISTLQSKIIHERYKTQQKISELQLKSIKNHIEPHFTFNLLNSISGLLYNNYVEKANYITEKYAKLLRHSLINSDNIITSFSEELEYIKHYLEIEKYRLEGKFTYTIDIEPGVKEDFDIPKMLVFTFVENAVKHGIRAIEGNGSIQLKLSEDRNTYLIEVMDNGIGMEKSGKHQQDSTNTGLKTVNEILNYFKQIKKKKIYYEISPLNDNFDINPGTHVKIFIPKDGIKRKRK